jgi:hypothetical protein
MMNYLSKSFFTHIDLKVSSLYCFNFLKEFLPPPSLVLYPTCVEANLPIFQYYPLILKSPYYFLS